MERNAVNFRILTMRLPISTLFGQNISSYYRPTLNAFLHTTRTYLKSKTTLAVKKKHYDPYKLAQIKLRRDANLSRQKELKEQRKVAMGDPVHGARTPYLESLKTTADSTEAGGDNGNKDDILNHFLTRRELEAAFDNSKFLSSPHKPKNHQVIDPFKEQQDLELHIKQHKNAINAITKIVSLSNGSSKDRTRANMARCIETFGRHNTDKFLKPRPPVHPSLVKEKNMPEKTPRAGPDTGSSEVQIAILTAKIQALSQSLEQSGNKDKVNKRNLRLLVHKRQKLLRYLHRKERGGERWQHLVETLGLTEGTWKVEISL